MLQPGPEHESGNAEGVGANMIFKICVYINVGLLHRAGDNFAELNLQVL